MKDNVIPVRKGQTVDRNDFLRRLVDALYMRNDIDLQRGNFRVKGDTVDIAMAYNDNVLRITWWDDEIDTIEEVDSVDFHRIASFDDYEIYPANLFVTSKEQTESAIRQIQDDLVKQVDFFKGIGDNIKAQRIKELGREARVPIVENKPLARTLYAAVQVGDAVPQELYQAVAEVLAYVYRLKHARRGA